MLDLLSLPSVGIATGLIVGSFFAYLLGVRDPFLLAAVAVAGGIAGLALECAPPARNHRARNNRRV
jgi:uncharacterized membrane protein